METRVVVTGFGKFGNILSNPTTEICRTLEKEQLSSLERVCVMETSKKAVLETLEEFQKQGLYDEPIVFLHLGVNSNIKRFELESTAYNAANFRVPDEQGWMAKAEALDSNVAYDSPCCTTLDLKSITADLKAKGFLVDISNDPGRYICNFVYYHSLRLTNVSR